jgi:hypothetical protein
MRAYWPKYKHSGTNKMNKENFFDAKQLLAWAKIVWSKAFWPIVALIAGMIVGSTDTESRITSDCKYAQSFRVGYQAFTCQRKI